MSKKFKVVKKSPLLVSKTRTGEDKFWCLMIVTDNDKDFYTQTESYHNTKSGKPSKSVSSIPYICIAKSIGRSNETTSKSQAELEFKSILKKQMDKGYSEIGKKNHSAKPLPMLAQKFSDREKYIKYPCITQPKLDGNRMLFDGKEAWSRGGKPIPNFENMTQFHNIDTRGYILDGELILPGNVLLQETNKARKHSPTELTYQVYDIVDDILSYADRLKILIGIVSANKSNKFFGIRADIIHSIDELRKNHLEYVSSGYEGTIIRNLDGKYTINQRSNDLQKYKDFVDEEFKIIRVESGAGSDTGCAIFWCKSNVNDKEFKARLEGTRENSKEVYKDRKNLINKFLTVKYQNLSKDGIPVFPVGVVVRDKGDF